MAQITLRIDDELLDTLDAEADDHGVSRSQYIRDTLESRHRRDELARENDRLRRQLRATNARQNDVSDLAEYVRDEQAIQQRREERRNAPAWRRAKWWLFGTPEYDADAGE